MAKVRRMRDLQAINDLCTAVGGLSAAARELSTPARPLRAQHIHNWRKRGRVAPEQRLNFLTVFNRVMPKRKHLDMTWLASPAAHYGNGSANHGGKSRRKARPKRKASRRRQAQDKRGGEPRARP